MSIVYPYVRADSALQFNMQIVPVGFTPHLFYINYTSPPSQLYSYKYETLSYPAGGNAHGYLHFELAHFYDIIQFVTET